MSSIHPARFSKEVIAVASEILLAEYPDGLGRPIIHDSWGGSGERLHHMCTTIDEWGFPHSGTEIEACFIDPTTGIIQGDSRDPSLYPPARFPDEVRVGGWVQFTSIVYPQGIADNFKATKPETRTTYRTAKMIITGDLDAELVDGNMGALGYRGTKREGTSVRRKRFWEIADATVANWSTARLVLLNCSDFKHSKGEIEPFVDDCAALLRRHGWANIACLPVGTRRMKNGANRDERVDYETIIVARRRS